jgi:site-specific recombinase XerD
MIDHFYSDPVVFECLRCGPLGPHIDGFAELLSQQGYSREIGAQKLRLISLLSGWIRQRKIGVHHLNEQRIAEFVKARRKQLRHQHGIWPTFAALLQFLREAHIEQDYAQFLRQERGLTQGTLDNYLPAARRFLSSRFGRDKICLNKLRPHDVTGFILRETSNYSRKRVQLVAGALRSFLGFLYQRGELATNLAASVPTVANWSLLELPQFLEPEQVEKLLSSCDSTTSLGKRNYAILLLLARLGLRAGEVVNLSLDDIDWEAGELLIRGKSAREERLPMLRDVGQALADYLQQRRTCPGCRRVFVRMAAPRRGFFSSAAVSAIVRRTLVRAQLYPEHRGAHLLRHSLATKMLRQGASLIQIGQILGHRLLQTTEIYAKVDLAALRALAQPWPGGAQ